MNDLIIKHNELTAEEFCILWASVWGSVFDGDTIIAMARVIGDMGLDYYIKDVVVRPEYQHKGIGRLLVGELLRFVHDHGVKGTEIFVELCAMPDKMPFYEKLGFDTNEAQRMKMMYRIE